MKTRCARALPALLALLWAAGVAAQTVPLRPLVTPPGVAVPLQAAPPPGRWTAVQLQEAFTAADSDGDQRLNRAESQQLLILPRAFEDMDLNKDGVLTREEYEGAALRG